MFRLSDLLEYDDIVIQCHNNPDADTISSAFGIYAYLQRKGKDPRMIYAGVDRIKKRNIELMLEWLHIPLEHIPSAEDFPSAEILVCVDCQYGERNIAAIDARKVAVVDHHPQVTDSFDLGTIQPQLSGCATLVWDLLRGEDFDFAEDKDVPTSLYYGLMTDTNGFTEMKHPLDRDMRDALEIYCDRGIVRKLAHCNLTIDDLGVAGVALLRRYEDATRRYALFKTEECDPNILGFISDIALQVDTVDVCVVYSQRENGVKFSVRSCTREVSAPEFAEYITLDGRVGSSGGHSDKAGGWINKTLVEEMDTTIDQFLRSRTEEYFGSYDLIDAGNHSIDTSKMARFRKKKIPRGCVLSTDAFPEDTPLLIRTLESDSHIKASPDIFLMIGVLGECYPMSSDKFRTVYKMCDDEVNVDDDIYTPTVKNEMTGEVKQLYPLMKPCIPVSEAPIFAKKLRRNTKVFTKWNPNGYMYGKKGDYLALRCDDIGDVYIIQKEIFAQTYEAV